jgi:hypothetical protein
VKAAVTGLDVVLLPGAKTTALLAAATTPTEAGQRRRSATIRSENQKISIQNVCG